MHRNYLCCLVWLSRNSAILGLVPWEKDDFTSFIDRALSNSSWSCVMIFSTAFPSAGSWTWSKINMLLWIYIYNSIFQSVKASHTEFCDYKSNEWSCMQTSIFSLFQFSRWKMVLSNIIGSWTESFHSSLSSGLQSAAALKAFILPHLWNKNSSSINVMGLAT